MTWMLTDDDVEKSAGVWTLRTLLASPDLGWKIRCDQAAERGNLLSIGSSVAMPRFQEVDRPQEDLLARYRPTTEPGISLDIRYQLLTVSPSRLVLQATYAVQTRAFETHPSLEITVPKLEQTELACIHQTYAAPFHVAIVMQACDVAQARLVDDGPDSRIQFFGDFMERGVIRKCRLRLILSPLSDQELQADQELEALAREPLPLVS
ncbi:hypothetical protein Poly24_11200 [Rosistilla carotiformis]|uniref:Uncharacterized protein n=1 Tax=Rosistilla carotiformis TaxID=2528017 RepID=A0A518JPF3_9BACT|nr:hypothetical protein [Rosistilla carotiformis]QDV67425.1 hypothetical protein Poly24_11200 [Rosistilla carotiformis]